MPCSSRRVTRDLLRALWDEPVPRVTVRSQLRTVYIPPFSIVDSLGSSPHRELNPGPFAQETNIACDSAEPSEYMIGVPSGMILIMLLM